MADQINLPCVAIIFHEEHTHSQGLTVLLAWLSYIYYIRKFRYFIIVTEFIYLAISIKTWNVNIQYMYCLGYLWQQLSVHHCCLS